MATFRFASVADRYPVGTAVDAYLRSSFPTGWDCRTAPEGEAAASGTVQADGSLVFTGLLDGARYVGHARVEGDDRFVTFGTARASAGAGSWSPGVELDEPLAAGQTFTGSWFEMPAAGGTVVAALRLEMLDGYIKAPILRVQESPDGVESRTVGEVDLSMTAVYMGRTAGDDGDRFGAVVVAVTTEPYARVVVAHPAEGGSLVSLRVTRQVIG